jgi:hypothetical protein
MHQQRIGEMIASRDRRREHPARPAQLLPDAPRAGSRGRTPPTTASNRRAHCAKN